jgi:hypothetical protein
MMSFACSGNSFLQNFSAVSMKNFAALKIVLHKFWFVGWDGVRGLGRLSYSFRADKQ